MTPCRAEVPKYGTDTMTLQDELQSISGIGPAKAEQAISIVNDYRGPRGPSVDPEAVDHAIDQARRGNEGAVIDFLETLR